MLTTVSDLFDEVSVGPVWFRNRIAMAPMGQHVSGADGHATPWHLVHYGSRAAGGCGLIVVEDTAVSPDGRVSERGLGLYEDAQVEGLRRITEFCRENGARMGIQLSHAGAKAFRDSRGHGWDIVSVGSDPYEAGWAAPRELGEHDLNRVVLAFAAAIERAVAAGFDVIEIHGTHGYLLHEFLSPARNRRADGFGGSLDHRARLLIDVLRAARRVCPDDRLLSVRLPARDGDENGLGPTDIADIATLCVREGAGLIALAGTLPSTGVVAEPDDYALTGRALRAAGVEHLMYSSGLTTVDGAARLASPSEATLVSVGRPLLLDPYWPIHVGQQSGAAVEVPAPYRFRS
jgi:2,4-dienoyl-CoA reductase-like NADH-dependent reductase (Old Yellow Enzyme family)